MPPIPRRIPTLKSTLANLLCATSAEMEIISIARNEVPTDFCAEYPRKINRGTIRKPPPSPEKEAPIPTSTPNKIITNIFGLIDDIYYAFHIFRDSRTLDS